MKSVPPFRNNGPDVTVTLPPIPFGGGLKIEFTLIVEVILVVGLNVLVFLGLFVIRLMFVFFVGQQHGCC
ncbi:hypothetical protein CEW92_13470 [Bacillaceae bacterium SAS-127]|nr:hypothetical protein CEW92_13470 [Bacillaceae bacterium SAS-127]